MGNRIDISDMVFGKLTVICFSHSDSRRHSYWKCHCSCGKISTVRGADLKRGKVKSCGKHYLWSLNKSEYGSWKRMLARCKGTAGEYSKKVYLNRGISVCDRWKSFENFLADMGRKPNHKYTIERIDNNGNYELNNCKWATLKEQARNRRNNYLVYVCGKQITLS